LKVSLAASEASFANVTQEVTNHQEALWNLSNLSLGNREILHSITNGAAKMVADSQAANNTADLLKKQAEETENSTDAQSEAAEELNAMGSVKVKTGECLAAKEKKTDGAEVQIWTCTKGQKEQQWVLTPSTGLFRNLHGICLAAPDPGTVGKSVMMWTCDASSAGQRWTYDKAAGHIKTSAGLCLDAATPSAAGSALTLATCSVAAPGQAWDMTVGSVGVRMRLDLLTNQMWTLDDPTDANSIQEMTKNVDKLEAETKSLGHLLAVKSRTVLASRLRHRARNLRKALDELGDAAGGLKPGVPDAFAQEPEPCNYDNEPLGSDLGLAG